jgi:hypothetical protein
VVNDNTANDVRRVWDLMKKIGFAMLVSYMTMAAAAVSGTRPNLGDNRKVSM